MSEKVLFEFRVEENEDGYSYVLEHDKEAFAEGCPSIMKYFLDSTAKKESRWMRIHRKRSKRRMRRRLDFFEKVYDEFYGHEDEDEE